MSTRKKFITTDLPPIEDRLEEIRVAGELLVRHAVLENVVLTISQASLTPLAMGYYASTIDVRAKAPYTTVTPEKIAEVRDAAEVFAHRAAMMQIVATIWQESTRPLRMGHYITRIAVRPARKLAKPCLQDQ